MTAAHGKYSEPARRILHIVDLAEPGYPGYAGSPAKHAIRVFLFVGSTVASYMIIYDHHDEIQQSRRNQLVSFSKGSK